MSLRWDLSTFFYLEEPYRKEKCWKEEQSGISLMESVSERKTGVDSRVHTKNYPGQLRVVIFSSGTGNYRTWLFAREWVYCGLQIWKGQTQMFLAFMLVFWCLDSDWAYSNEVTQSSLSLCAGLIHRCEDKRHNPLFIWRLHSSATGRKKETKTTVMHTLITTCKDLNTRVIWTAVF